MTGLCKRKAATETIQLTRAPKFLLIQLLRYDNQEQKICTFIKLDTKLVLPSGDMYKLLGTLNHIGQMRKYGHYIANLKCATGNWVRLDDAYSQPTSLEQVNSADNYILLFTKMEPGILELGVFISVNVYLPKRLLIVYE